MSDTLNVAGMHKEEIIAAIEAATTAELYELDRQLAAQGWSADGVLRRRIAARLQEG